MRATTATPPAMVDTRRVSVTATDAATGEVLVRDTNGVEFAVVGTTRPKGTGFPAVGEIWLVQRIGPAWMLRTQIGATAPPVITGEVPAGSALAATVSGLDTLGLIRDATTEGPGGSGGVDEVAVNALIDAALNNVADPVDPTDAVNRHYVDDVAAFGVQGKSAYQVAIDNGFVGTQAQWLTSLEGADGTNGASAYDVAVSNGFVGTQAQWLASLKGATGDPGAKWYTGVGAPAAGTGANGDFYLNASNGDFYGPKASGAWSSAAGSIRGPQGVAGPANTLAIGSVTTGAAGSGASASITGTAPNQSLSLTIPRGDPGTNGTDGNTVLYGTGAPAAGTGVDGNFYIDTTAHVLYGPKAAGAWPAGTALIGPQGSPGQSAYQIDVANGYPGTQAQWLASQKTPATGAFVARLSTGAMAGVSGERPLTFDSVMRMDSGYTFSLATNGVTVPADGWYAIEAHVRLTTGVSGTHSMQVKAGSAYVLRGNQILATLTETFCEGMVYLTAGTELVPVYNSTTSTAIVGDAAGEGVYFRVVLLSTGPQGPQGVKGADGSVAFVAEQATAMPQRGTLNFKDPGFNLTDDPANGRTDVETTFVLGDGTRRLTVGTVRPSSPQVGDLFVNMA